MLLTPSFQYPNIATSFLSSPTVDRKCFRIARISLRSPAPPHDVARGIGELACSYRQWAVGLGGICAHAVKLQAGEGGQFSEGDLVICCDPADSDDVGR